MFTYLFTIYNNFGHTRLGLYLFIQDNGKTDEASPESPTAEVDDQSIASVATEQNDKESIKVIPTNVQFV